MSSDLVPSGGREVDRTFRWLDAQLNEHDPAEMELRHLWFTVRMIWNHSVPEVAQTPNGHRRWRFGPRHTPEYLARAVSVMIPLLEEQRWRMEPTWRAEYLWILGWIHSQKYPGGESAMLTEVRRLSHDER